MSAPQFIRGANSTRAGDQPAGPIADLRLNALISLNRAHFSRHAHGRLRRWPSIGMQPIE
jgi:hypothetical protein